MTKRTGVVAATFGLFAALLVATGGMSLRRFQWVAGIAVGVAAILIAASTVASAQTATGQVTVSVRIAEDLRFEEGGWSYGFNAGDDLVQRKRTLQAINPHTGEVTTTYGNSRYSFWQIDSNCHETENPDYPDMEWMVFSSRQPMRLLVPNVRIIRPRMTWYDDHHAQSMGLNNAGVYLEYETVKFGTWKFDPESVPSSWEGFTSAEADALLRLQGNWKTASTIEPTIAFVNGDVNAYSFSLIHIRFEQTFTCDEVFGVEAPTAP